MSVNEPSRKRPSIRPLPHAKAIPINPTRRKIIAKDKPQCPVMTTAAGVPVADNQNSLTAGARGPDPVADNQPGAR